MEDILKDNPKVKKAEGMLNPKANQEVSLHEGCHNWKGKWTR